MTIDRFTLDEFEQFLDCYKPSPEKSFEMNEYVFRIRVDGQALIKIRSSIGESQIADDVGQDSIRLYLISNEDELLAQMDAVYVTRVHGWRERVTEKIKQLTEVRMRAGDCKICDQPLRVFKVKKETKNKGRFFATCEEREHKIFKWMDEPSAAYTSDKSTVMVDGIEMSRAGENVIIDLGEASDKQVADLAKDLNGDSITVVFPDKNFAENFENELEAFEDEPEGIPTSLPKSSELGIDISPWQGTDPAKGGDFTAIQKVDLDRYDATALGLMSSVWVANYSKEELTPNTQQDAVITFPVDQPLRVMAGPGSGKTFCMARRYTHLVDNGVLPMRIAAITYSAKMASELRDKIIEQNPYIKNSQAERQITTIHALCRRFLVAYGTIKNSVQIPKGWQWKKMLEEVLQEVERDFEKRPLWKETSDWLATVKSFGVLPEDAVGALINAGLEPYQAKMIQEVWYKTEHRMNHANQIMFSDMIHKVDMLLQTDLEFKAYMQGKITHIILDEAQDTNYQSIRIIRNISDKNVTFVGDINQLLYRFAGATPEANLLEGFEENYPDGQLLKLGVNYRSVSEIVNASDMILQNYEPIGPYPESSYNQMVPNREDKGQFTFDAFDTPTEESQYIADMIRQAMDASESPEKVCEQIFIGMRTRAYSVYFEDACARLNIPFINTTGMSFWLLHHVVKLVAYLRVMNDWEDAQAFSQIYNVPSRYWTAPWRSMKNYNEYMTSRLLSKQFIQEYPSYQSLIDNYDDNPYSKYSSFPKKFIPGTEDIIQTIEAGLPLIQEQKPPAEVLIHLIENIFARWLSFEYGGSEEGEEGDGSKMDDLRGVIEIAEMFSTTEEFLTYVKNMIEAAQAKSMNDWSGKVVLATIHKLKGLERDVVFAVGVSEYDPDLSDSVASLLPHTFSFMPPPNDGKLPSSGQNSIEDERCLYFVLVTRARKLVHVSSIRLYRKNLMTASRFIRESQISLGGFKQDILEKPEYSEDHY